MCFSRNIYDLGCNKNPALASSVVLFLTSVTTNDKLIFRKKSSLLYMEIKVGVGGGGKKENKESPNPSSSDKGLVFLLSSCFSLNFFFQISKCSPELPAAESLGGQTSSLGVEPRNLHELPS